LVGVCSNKRKSVVVISSGSLFCDVEFTKNNLIQ